MSDIPDFLRAGRKLTQPLVGRDDLRSTVTAWLSVGVCYLLSSLRVSCFHWTLGTQPIALLALSILLAQARVDAVA